MNPLRELQTYGQSVWLDYIRRSAIASGEILNFIKDDDVRGVTSNPAIFQKAIAGSSDYDLALKQLEQERDRDAQELYEHLAIADIQSAADILAPVYKKTKKQDGYVSLEVSPYLANQTEATLSEARRLWQVVNRPNVMIKVPATPEGIIAIEQLIGEGINVNVTLLFSQLAYQQVVEAYMSGLSAYVQKGGNAGQVASVASFFVSRIDTAVDTQITKKIKAASSQAEQEQLKNLLGKVAISNAKLAYQHYQEAYTQEHWQALANLGAVPQRLLWASTGNKNPNYSDVRYVEELIGENTVNTIPPATLAMFRDRGTPRASLTTNPEYAQQVLTSLEQAGISLDSITAELLENGVKLFAQAFDKLLASVEHKREALLGNKLNRLSYSLPETLAAEVKETLQKWQDEGKIRRLWAMDSTLWSDTDESHWLGWLGIAEDQLAHINHLQNLAKEVKDSGFAHAVLLGMGGSSLCPEVMRLTFGKIPNFPQLHILDSTDPTQIKALENEIDLGNTLFIVSSKSGNTLEPNIFKEYFFNRVKDKLGIAEVGDRFIAVTDPGSHLEGIAQKDNFRHIYYGLPGIGGRYSALSDFGMVPAAVMGVDVAEFLDEAAEMVHSCAASVPATENPGVILGAILGVAANKGLDKVTIACSPGIDDLGAWLEQLLAESTGKQGKGLIPVAEEELGVPGVYSRDRLFVYIRLENEADTTQDTAIATLKDAGYPVVQIPMNSHYRLGQEFFRWEMATAVAGSIIGINAFNQPDVEASKNVTRQLTTEYEKTQQLPALTPFYEEAGIELYTDSQNTEALKHNLEAESLTEYFRAHLNRINPGDYVALLAYINRSEEHQAKLQQTRHLIRDRQHTATCLGFGPRFLHSTGQAYKGGPNSGVFLQITCDDAEKLPVPEHKYDFSLVKEAQARGDFQVLVERDRRALRIHLSKNVAEGLDKVQQAMVEALA